MTESIGNRLTIALFVLCMRSVMTHAIEMDAAALYRFEAQGDAIAVGEFLMDASGNDRHAEASNGVIDLVAGQAGLGQAGSFDQSLAFVDFEDVDTSGDFTFAFWMKSATLAQAEVVLLALSIGSGGGEQTAVIYQYQQDTVELYSGNSATDLRSGSQLSVPDTEWHHIVYTRSGSDYDAYLDGAKHDISPETMWFTAAVDLDPWIQYEFDTVKKLDTMTVWNSNGSAESAIGWGVKDVEIAISVDGETWEILADANQLSRAPGLLTYDHYDTVDFGGAAAKIVRLNIQSNWGGMLMAYGLSEVQFSMIPTRARTPEPAFGTVDVRPDAQLIWRAGREAAQHVIYVSTDPNEVANGTATFVTTSTNTLNLTSLNLELGQTYTWRVDEVNEAETPAMWAGSLWCDADHR